MNHREAIDKALDVLSPREETYGSPQENFGRIAKIAAVLLNRNVSEWEVAAFLLATKLGRIPNDPTYEDSYIDGINYLAFMAEFKDGVLK